MKFHWKVAPQATGRYHAFDKRQWPHAETAEGHVVCGIHCEDSYTPARARGEQDHGPLAVSIRFASSPEEKERFGSFRWRSLKKRFDTLDEAKDAFTRWVEQNPDHNWGV